jgi:hypothetical protein
MKGGEAKYVESWADKKGGGRRSSKLLLSLLLLYISFKLFFYTSINI